MGNTRSIRGENLFFRREKSKRRDQSSFSFLENINFWKSLPRAPEFEYPPLVSGSLSKAHSKCYGTRVKNTREPTNVQQFCLLKQTQIVTLKLIERNTLHLH